MKNKLLYLFEYKGITGNNRILIKERRKSRKSRILVKQSLSKSNINTLKC